MSRKKQAVHIRSSRQSAISSQFVTIGCKFFTFCFLLFTSAASAQTVSATIDREKIVLGEQITLQLKAEGIDPQKSPINTWFNLPDTINHLEVVNRSAIDTLDINGLTSYTQNIIITSFDSGKWILPALQLNIQNAGKNLHTDSLAIEVLPVDVSNLQQYHNIKDIIPVEVKTDWWRTILIAALVIAILTAVYFYFSKKKKAKPAAPLSVRLSLFEETIAQLEALQKEATMPAILFYTKLDAICRNYVQEQLYIQAKHLTNDELVIQLNVYLQQMEIRTEFYQLLRLIAAVKFAKYIPPDVQNAQAISTAKTTVQHIHYQLQRTLKNNA